MHVRYVANSCFVITLASGRRLLTDPWFDGPCQETWWNYPPVHQSLKAEVSGLEPDWIYISHLHQDHLHPPSLDHYGRDTPILIGRLNTPNLRTALQRLGFRNIREEAFDHTFDLEPGGCQAVLFSDFHATTTGGESLLDYDLDTSIFLFDSDGTRLFNAVDNTIQPEDAAQLKARYGAPHMAVLPYASASIFPMGMAGYSDQAKLGATAAVRQRSATRFAALVAALQPDHAVPAGGEYVLGGPAAALTRYLPQPLEAELALALDAAGVTRQRMVKLHAGDAVDLFGPRATLQHDPAALERRHTDETRAEYALTLQDQTPDYARVDVERLRPDWARLLGRSARALKTRAQAIGYAPPLDLHIVVRRWADQAPLFTYGIALDGGEGGMLAGPPAAPPSEGRSHVAYSLDERLLFCLLTGLLSWNAMEASALIGLERTPDVYDADLHRVIVYFNVLS
jgi:UDP-MurNAc hydroxylase